MGEEYELQRVGDAGVFYRKLRVKRLLYRLVGELYIGKRVKLAYFRRWLRRIALPYGACVLEAGSGDGLFAFFTAAHQQTASITGLELNPAEVDACRRIAWAEGLTNLKFVVGNVLDLSWTDEFDLIYCLDVLEHIEQDERAVRNLWTALKPGGSLLIHVPGRAFMRPNGQIVVLTDAEARLTNAGHVRAGYTPREIAGKLAACGFHILAIRPTQGRAISCAHALHARAERFSPLRVLILPAIDLLTWVDMRSRSAHGNTVWAWARKPLSHG